MKVTIKRSKIHGLGVFATEDIAPGVEVVDVTVPHYDHNNSFYHLTLVGKRVNHSYIPNSFLKKVWDGKLVKHVLTTIHRVPKDGELTLNYNILEDFGPAGPEYK